MVAEGGRPEELVLRDRVPTPDQAWVRDVLYR